MQRLLVSGVVRLIQVVRRQGVKCLNEWDYQLPGRVHPSCTDPQRVFDNPVYDTRQFLN